MIIARSWRILACAGFLLLWMGLLAHRYRSGHNYQPIHVRVDDGGVSSGKYEVGVRSPWGTEGRLIQNDHDPRIWSSSDSISPVAAIIVRNTGAGESATTPRQLYFRCGDPHGPYETLLLPQSTTRVPSNNAGPDKKAAQVFRPERLCRSLLPLPKKVLNWEGDAFLLVTPALQSFLICIPVLAAIFILRKLCSIPKGPVAPRVRPKGILERVQLYSVALIFLLSVATLAHHLMIQVPALSDFGRDGLQLLTVVGIMAGIVILVTTYVLTINRQRNNSAVFKCAAGWIAITLALKIAWAIGVTSVQINDYGVYWSCGKIMAKGGWNSFAGVDLAKPDTNASVSSTATQQGSNKEQPIAGATDPLGTIVAGRSFLYTYPAAVLGNGSPTGLKITNIFLQCLGLWLFFRLVASILTVRAAAFALPFLTFHPDFWFAMTVATHDIPGIFWLIVLLLLFHRTEKLLVQATAECGFCRRAPFWARLLALSSGCGVAAGLVSVQRGYDPIIVGTLIFYCCATWLSRRGCWRTMASTRTRGMAIGASATGLLAILIGVWAMSHTISGTRGYLERKTGHLGSYPMLAYLSAAQTARLCTYDDMYPWLHEYFPSVDRTSLPELVARKLAYEKLATGPQFLLHMFRKDRTLGGVGWPMIIAAGGIEGQWSPNRSAIPWLSARLFLCSASFSVLVALALMRLLFIRRFPVTRGEQFSLLFCLVGMAMLLGLTEVKSSYDLFLVLPMAWSAGLVLAAVTGVAIKSTANSEIPEESTRSMDAYTLIKTGLVVCLALTTLHAIAGYLVTKSSLAFCKIRPVLQAPLSPMVESTPVSVSLGLPQCPDGRVASGCKSVAEFDIKGKADSNAPLRFFVSGDQRRKMQKDPLPWGSVPAKFQVLLDGVEVVSGPIEQLSRPRFVTAARSASSASGSTPRLTLVLEALGDYSTAELPYPPVIAVEYVY